MQQLTTEIIFLNETIDASNKIKALKEETNQAKLTINDMNEIK